MKSVRMLSIAACFLTVILPAAAKAQTETVLHDFQKCQSCAYGGGHALLLKGSHLYGVADGQQDSEVFSLAIPPGGPTTFKKMYTFPAGDGGDFGPTSGLVSDAQGNLYGPLKNGGLYDDGGVFKLAPPAKGQTGWTETLIYSFNPANDNGGTVNNGLAIDSSGALYGATNYGLTTDPYCGTVFKLTPPTGGGAWTATTLYVFSGPDGCQVRGNLLLDPSGAIYGATESGGQYGGGTVYTLAPPASGQTSWELTTLYNFTGDVDGLQPNGGLIGGAGDLWGTTTGGGAAASACGTNWCGTVFELSRQVLGDPTYTLTTWHYFNAGSDGFTPRAGLYLDANGTFWGTTYYGGEPGFGTIFKLARDPIRTTYDYSEVYAFRGPSAGDGENPGCSLTEDAGGAIYGTTVAGGSKRGGTVFKLVP